MTEKRLKLDKADFAVNNHKVDEDQYPQQPDKVAFLSGKSNMKADEVMTNVPSNEDIDDNVVPPGDAYAIPELDAQESSDEEEEEGNSEDHSILLVGTQLDVVSVGKEENEELTRTRGQATLHKLFNSTSQPSLSNLRQRSRAFLSPPLLPPNSSKSRRGKHPTDSYGRRKQRALEETDATMIVALQESMSES
jgi:hypothetical protein